MRVHRTCFTEKIGRRTIFCIEKAQMCIHLTAAWFTWTYGSRWFIVRISNLSSWVPVQGSMMKQRAVSLDKPLWNELRNYKYFTATNRAEHTNDTLSIQTVELLMTHCNSLLTLSELESWEGITSSELSDFR